MNNSPNRPPRETTGIGWGAGQYTHGHRAAIHEANRVCSRPPINQKLLMKPLLDHPEMGGLLSKGSAPADGGKPRLPMVAKVLPETHIGLQTQKLADYFHREEFTLRQLRGKTPLAPAVIPYQGTQVFFYPAIHGKDKVFERHSGITVRLRLVGSLST